MSYDSITKEIVYIPSINNKNGTITINSNNKSTGTKTGALVVNGGVGSVDNNSRESGFGGGGRHGNTHGGGGGGYSGGGGSVNHPWEGGGGGSYNNGSSKTTLVGSTNGHLGDGKVIITLV